MTDERGGGDRRADRRVRGADPDRPEILNHVARYLRQQRELGGGTIPLETLDSTEVLQMLGAARIRGTSSDIVDTAPAEVPSARADSEIRQPRITRPDIQATDPDPEVPAEETAASASIRDLPADHGTIRSAALDCTRCRLCEDRTQVVFHDGTPDARLMVVGEAPGANEDRTGVPFVGAAGKFLDLLMASVGLTREESVYICNVLKCRPPGNRNPKADEIETCSPWLRRQIELVRPEVILAVGTFSAQLLSGRDMALGKLRGEIYSYEGIPLVVTYHPAALLRNSRWTRPTWEDFQLLRQVMEERAA